MKKNKKRIRVKTNVKWFTLILFVMASTLILGTLSIHIYEQTQTEVVEDSMIYNETGSFDYSVCLYQNDYIKNECISEKRSFITALVDKINLKLNYNLNASKMGDYIYSYKITAVIEATEKNDSAKVLYTNTEILSEEDNLKVQNDNVISIDKLISLNYQDYNSIITSFKKNYVISVDSEMRIIAEITVKGETEGLNSEISKDYTMNMTIPLAEQTVNIETKDTAISNKNQEIVKYATKKKYNKNSLLFDFILLLDAVYLVFLLYFLTKYYPKVSEYKKRTKKILKAYDGVIVTVEEWMEFDDTYSFNRVSKFEELLDVRESLQKPIIHYETEDKDATYFYIIDDKIVYMYLIEADGGENR